MKQSLSDESLRDLSSKLQQANSDFANYPGETGKRQPVHTVYGGAHLFKSDSAERLGALARRSLDQFAPDFLSFAKAIELPGADELPDSLEEDGGLLNRLETNAEHVRRENRSAWFAHAIYNRVSEKLRREPVEDFRIDFEDGYGNRPDEEEDGHAASAALEVADRNGKRHAAALHWHPHQTIQRRVARAQHAHARYFCFDVGREVRRPFAGQLCRHAPKITIPEQVGALADIFELLEKQNRSDMQAL